MDLYITKLDQNHDVSGFDCGVPALNNWLQSTASQHQKKYLSSTYVLVDADNPTAIIGFYALAPRGLVPKQGLPPAMVRKLPNNIPAYTLARLAVSVSHGGQGNGGGLLINAMARAKKAAEQAGGSLLFVDAKDGADGFYKHFNFVPLPNDPLTLVMPIASIEVGELGEREEEQAGNS
jgi:GNAT superfamily N-acetyltransferase